MGISQPPPGTDVSFEPVREGWSIYRTKDKFEATISLKVTILKFRLTSIDEFGNPNYVAGSNPIIMTVSVRAEKKGTPVNRVYTQKEILDAIEEVDISFDTIREDWNEYKLEDDIVVKMKPIATVVSRTSLIDQNGDPIYWVQNQPIIKAAITKEMRERFLKLRESIAR